MLGNELIIILDPTEPVPDGRGGYKVTYREHRRYARQVRQRSSEAMEPGSVVVLEQKIELELFTDAIVDRIDTNFLVEWRNKTWNVRGVTPVPLRLAPRNKVKIEVELREVGD